MVPRAKSGIVKPKAYSTSIALEPLNVSDALFTPHWKAAMQAEYDALLKNHTWELVPPPNHTIIQCKWIFRVKYHADGSLDKYKARLVAKGFQQVPGINFFNTFSLVVKSTTIRIIFSLVVTRG